MPALKIGICGPSGSGKTTLAKYIAEAFDLQFISLSAKEIWKDHNIINHADIIQKSILETHWGLNFQYQLLDYRNKYLTNKNNFVTDRTPIDNLVYFMLQNSWMVNEEENKKYIIACMESLKHYSGIIFIQYSNDIKLENDNQRINNPYYQQLTSQIFNYVISLITKNYGIKINLCQLASWELEYRKNKVNKFLINLITQ